MRAAKSPCSRVQGANWAACSSTASSSLRFHGSSYAPGGGPSAAQCRARGAGNTAAGPAKNAAARRQKKGHPPLLCASGRPDTQKNNSQLSGCDLNILTQDPGSIPAAYTFRKNSKNEK